MTDIDKNIYEAWDVLGEALYEGLDMVRNLYGADMVRFFASQARWDTFAQEQATKLLTDMGLRLPETGV